METSYDVRIWKTHVYQGRTNDDAHGPVGGSGPAMEGAVPDGGARGGVPVGTGYRCPSR